MTYLVAVFIPPLYFLIKRKWVALVVSSFLLVLSLFLAMTVVLIPVSLILWGLCAVVGVYDLRKALMHEHATIIAEKMASKMAETMRQQSAPLSPPRS
jgi:uncharacterized membrane protein